MRPHSDAVELAQQIAMAARERVPDQAQILLLTEGLTPDHYNYYASFWFNEPAELAHFVRNAFIWVCCDEAAGGDLEPSVAEVADRIEHHGLQTGLRDALNELTRPSMKVFWVGNPVDTFAGAEPATQSLIRMFRDCSQRRPQMPLYPDQVPRFLEMLASFDDYGGRGWLRFL